MIFWLIPGLVAVFFLSAGTHAVASKKSSRTARHLGIALWVVGFACMYVCVAAVYREIGP